RAYYFFVNPLYLEWNTLKNEILRWNEAMPIISPVFERAFSTL
ncbi:MAG: hypothetical protein UX06_C0024G0001, partial [Candidatus Giovannonibacteria bacterium GW2011_GWA2_45_21]